MKRQADNSHGQPSVKKPDITSDLFRSKIAAKLQTLLDGISSESLNCVDEDIKPDVSLLHQGPQDIVKPGVADKSSSNTKEDFIDTLSLKNFIISAKSRITELLTKGKHLQCKDLDGEKENSLAGSSVHLSKVKTLSIDPLQTQISHKLQSLLCKALDKKKFAKEDIETSDASNTDVVISEGDWQDLSIIFEDFVKSAKKKVANLLSVESQSADSTFSTQIQQNCSQNIGAVTSSQKVSNNVKLSKKKEPVTASQNPIISVSKRNSFSTKSSHLKIMESQISNEGIMVISDSEDDLEILTNNVNSSSTLPSNASPHNEGDGKCCENTNSDSEVIIVEEKRRSYEIITLEEDDDDDEPIEELYPCPQCAKRFRAESLLKFHIRMHGPSCPEEGSAEGITNVEQLSSPNCEQRSAEIDSDGSVEITENHLEVDAASSKKDKSVQQKRGAQRRCKKFATGKSVAKE